MRRAQVRPVVVWGLEPAWAYAIVAAAALAESIPFIGVLIPGALAIAAAAVASGRGELDPFVVFACGVLPGVGGDLLGFALGRRRGQAMLEHSRVARRVLPAARRKALVAAVQGKPWRTVAGARLQLPARAIVPVFAGHAGVRLRTFVGANLSAAGFSMATLVLGGWLAGRGAPRAGHIVGWVTGGVILVLGAFYVVGLVRALRAAKRDGGETESPPGSAGEGPASRP